MFSLRRMRRSQVGPPPEAERGGLDVGVYLDLLKMEYDSLRNESVQARSAQQQILQWSLATIAAVFAAGVVFATGSTDKVDSGFSGTIFLIVFAVALPGAIITSCWAWIGELVRMERAGYFLRGVEAQVRALRFGNDAPANGPWRWETYLAYGYSGRRGKSVVGYMGAAGLYFGSLAVSGAITVAAAHDHRFADSTPGFVRTALLFSPVVWTAVLLVSTLLMARSLLRMSRLSCDLAAVAGPSHVSEVPIPRLVSGDPGEEV